MKDLDPELLTRRLERERLARQSAERLLEEKSHELYLAQQAAEQKAADLAVANLRLEEARDAAIEVSAHKSRLLANMSHEVRTPLNAVLGFLDEAVNWDLPPGQHTQLHHCRSAAEQLLALINDALDLSKFEAGVLALYPRPTNVRLLLAEICANEADEIAAKNLGFEVSLEVTEKPLMVDPTRLRRIVSHILVNAAKFTREGTITLRANRPSPDLLHVEVQDTGPGIALENIDSLFSRFTRGSQPDAGVRGAGLGLAVVRTLSEAMGGDAGVVSEVGVGSTFWVEVPCPLAPLTQNSGHTLQAMGLKVLVVDDERVNRMILHRHLRELGCQVWEATCGEEALAHAESSPLDVVIMDLRMPGMDGLEAGRRLRRLRPDLPVLACSASVLEEDRLAAERAGMVGFIPKPVRRPDLADALCRAHSVPIQSYSN